MIRRTVVQIAGEDLARMLERDGLRCAAALLRLWVGGNRAASGAMELILADLAQSRPVSDDQRAVYTVAAKAIRDGHGYVALGALAALVGDDAASVYAERCAREQGVEVQP